MDVKCWKIIPHLFWMVHSKATPKNFYHIYFIHMDNIIAAEFVFLPNKMVYVRLFTSIKNEPSN